MSFPQRLTIDGEAGALLAALQRDGCLHLAAPNLPSTRLAEALHDARTFFALPIEGRRALAIERSPHFRGYSIMDTARDHREQLHLGREAQAAGAEPPWRRLEGPNPWPADAAWRRRMSAWIDDVSTLGRALLSRLGDALGMRPEALPTGDPYVLLKLIRYHAQANTSAPRPGVAAHVDFSWLTLTLQDDVGGLEMRDRNGRWREVPPAPDALLVHAGELLQFATAGALPATPHRVVNRSGGKARLSLPLFLCPNLGAFVPAPEQPQAAPTDAEHVHRVLPCTGRIDGFVFGEAEWRRKGESRWCAACTRPAPG